MQNRATKAIEKRYVDYFAIAESIATLLFPFAEVVIHDAPSGKIVRIWNAFSQRKAGQPSHLEGARDLFTDDRVLGPYEKALPSQARTKSITAALYDAEGKVVGFFCVNIDMTIIDSTMAQLAAFAAIGPEPRPPIYLNDLEQRLNYLVRDYLLSINKTAESMTRSERVGVVRVINDSGLFQARNAMRLVAKILGMSRASIYNLLAEANKTAPKSNGVDVGAASRIQRANAIAANMLGPKPNARVRGRSRASQTS